MLLLCTYHPPAKLQHNSKGCLRKKGFLDSLFFISGNSAKIMLDNYIGKRYNSITATDISYYVINKFGDDELAGEQ